MGRPSEPMPLPASGHREDEHPKKRLRRRAARVLQGILLAGLTTALCLVAGEFAARAFVDRGDYLEPRILDDPVLGRRIEPGSAGYDAWGFRNDSVPRHADIVTIGDSQTFGWTAPASESWPAWLERRTGRSVYNLALGGYGPLRYRYLFQHYALQLSPHTVVFGLYLGNDIADAYNFSRKRRLAEQDTASSTTPSLDLTSKSTATGTPEVSVRSPRHRLFGGVRRWLAAHSVLFQIAKFRLTGVVAFLRYHEARKVEGSETVTLKTPVATTMFEPERDLRPLDLTSKRIRSGLDTTESVFRQLGQSCRDRELRCAVLLIPTKESVFSELARGRLPDSDLARIEGVVDAEGRVRSELTPTFTKVGLQCIDPLPLLREAAARTKLYPTNQGSHPHGSGYEVLAHAVTMALEQASPPTPVRCARDTAP